MVRTMPRVISSSAHSQDVQWLTGRPQSSGASQATATNWHSGSGVNVAGRPRRGPSRKTCWRRSRSVSASASASAAASGGVAWAQRLRQSRTVGSLTPSASAAMPGSGPVRTLYDNAGSLDFVVRPSPTVDQLCENGSLPVREGQGSRARSSGGAHVYSSCNQVAWPDPAGCEECILNQKVGFAKLY